MIETWGKRTAVDALPIGGKKRIVWEMKGPVTIAHNELKGSKHLTQCGFRVVILPGENALGRITPSQKKDLCMGRIHPQQALIHIEKQAMGTQPDRGIRSIRHRELHHLETLFQRG